MKFIPLVSLLIAVAMPQCSFAALCDYTPSHLFGTKATVATGVVAGVGVVAIKVAGLYAFPHATAGTMMLGSTAAGASAAGTLGIIGGTGGIIGTVGAALLSPFVIVPAALAATGIGLYEGVCYMASDDEAESTGKGHKETPQ